MLEALLVRADVTHVFMRGVALRVMQRQSLAFKSGQIWWRQVILWLIRMLESSLLGRSILLSVIHFKLFFVVKDNLLALRMGGTGCGKARIQLAILFHYALNTKLLVRL